MHWFMMLPSPSFKNGKPHILYRKSTTHSPRNPIVLKSKSNKSLDKPDTNQTPSERKGKNIKSDDPYYSQILVGRTTAYLYITTSRIPTTARCSCLLVASHWRGQYHLRLISPLPIQAVLRPVCQPATYLAAYESIGGMVKPGSELVYA